MASVSYHIIESGVNGWNMKRKIRGGKHVLVVRHNAGYFSCLSIRLLDIMIYFNTYKALPDEVDSTEQFLHYKSYPGQNLVPMYFLDKDSPQIEYTRPVVLTHAKEEPQYSDYRLIDFNDTLPFVERYFSPSNHVGGIVEHFEKAYGLDYNNLCAVFYRGNDKARETSIASYDAFIEKAREIKAKAPHIKFLVQPDETEFLEAFQAAFPNDTVHFAETPHMRRKDSAMFYELPLHERAEFGAKFFAAVICLSRCRHMIIHSGNCAFWSILYRGNMDNVHQILNGVWL